MAAGTGVGSTDVLLAQLPGVWTLDRLILPDGGTVRGTVSFTPTEERTLRCDEAGTMRLASGHVGEVTRSYHWVFGRDELAIRFAEPWRAGQTLHTLRFGDDGRRASDVHVCGDDHYDGAYDFASDALVTVTIRVRGPAKDYTLHSRYHGPPRPLDERG